METNFLVGAYGMFWRKDEVDWGVRGWQMLGYTGGRKEPAVVCDFRRTSGFYILYGDYGPVYVGLARGSAGIGARLVSHFDEKEGWDRFSWFALDTVESPGHSGHWATVRRRTHLGDLPAHDAITEIEALLINLFGTHRSPGRGRGQNHMRFREAVEWKQLTYRAVDDDALHEAMSDPHLSDPQYWEPVLGRAKEG